MQYGGITDLLIKKRKLSDFGWSIYLPNTGNRAKICQWTAEILWCIWCEYKYGGARLTTLPSGFVNRLVWFVERSNLYKTSVAVGPAAIKPVDKVRDLDVVLVSELTTKQQNF